MTRNLRWERHGDMWRGIDHDGWTRVVIFYDSGTNGYEAICNIGLGSRSLLRELFATNRKKLMRDIEKLRRETGTR